MSCCSCPHRSCCAAIENMTTTIGRIEVDFDHSKMKEMNDEENDTDSNLLPFRDGSLG